MHVGARLDNPVTGQFTSVDPVYDGGATAYAYPIDSVKMFDLDGELWGGLKKGVKKAAKKTVQIAWKYKYGIALPVAPGGMAVCGGTDGGEDLSRSECV